MFCGVFSLGVVAPGDALCLYAEEGLAAVKVLLITGSFPPDVCGTADYTARLCEALQAAGVEARVFCGKDWRLSRVPSLLREIEETKPDVIHMQYPTTG